MKTVVIAQHHGSFLTLDSLIQNNIDDVTVIIPGSQVVKYNKMYNDNQYNPEFEAFQDYDKKVSSFLKERGVNYKVYVVDNFDVRCTVLSTLSVANELGYNEVVACILSGCVVVNDYTATAKADLGVKEFGFCRARVYQDHPNLSMYHMIGLPQRDPSLDVNFFVVDMSKIEPLLSQFTTDSQLLSDATKRKQITYLPREYNGKDDPLIGQAISARQTVAHNLKIQAGYVANLWNKSIKASGTLLSEEVYGYPFNIYGDYARNVRQYLPTSTADKIIANGDETKKCTDGLYKCLDIIDL